MNSDVAADVDWVEWLRRWDAQQEGYVPEREARFSAMLDVLDELLPESFVALDLGLVDPDRSASGSSLGFLPRQATAVEIDPVMLAIGRGALGTVNGRLRWVAGRSGVTRLASGLGRRDPGRCGAQQHRAALVVA